MILRNAAQRQTKDSKGYIAKNATKPLAAIVKLVFEIIPQDQKASRTTDMRQIDAPGSIVGRSLRNILPADLTPQIKVTTHRCCTLPKHSLWDNPVCGKRGGLAHMASAKTYDRLTRALRDTFESEALVATPELTARMVEGWDSLGNVRLFVELETVFGVRFNATEIASLENVGQLADLIEKKIGRANE